jgi:acyl carrier protein
VAKVIDQDLRTQIKELVLLASGGAISMEELESADGSLELVGFNSIAYINLMEALEQTMGVIIDPEEDPEYLNSVDSIAAFVEAQRRIPPTTVG